MLAGEYGRVSRRPVLVAMSMVLCASCGGGGGGGGTEPRGGAAGETFLVSPASLDVHAASNDGAAQATIDVTRTGGPEVAYVDMTNTVNAVSTLSGEPVNGAFRITVQFRPVSFEEYGTTFADTITIKVCHDTACATPFANSPQTIPVKYNVSPVRRPWISGISPDTAVAGDGALMLSATGSDFTTSSVVLWNGSPLQTSYVSPTSVQAQVPASLIANVSTANVRVAGDAALNFPSTSSSLFTIAASAPIGVDAVGPTKVTVGERTFTLAVSGQNFRRGAVALWNGSPRPTTWVSTTEVTALISAADVASIGNANVSVENLPSTDTSATLQISIVPASIDATGLQINSAHNGVIAFKNVSLPASSKWSASFPHAISYPLIADGKVFVISTVGTSYFTNSSSEVSALSQASGAKIWGPVVIAGAASATFDNGKLFVVSASSGGSSGTLLALDAATGTTAWSATLAGQYVFSSPPTARDGMVFVSAAGSGGTVYAVSQKDGTVVWTKIVNGGDASSPMVSVDSVAVAYPCQTYVFRPLTGTQVWRDDRGCDGGGGGTSVEANGVLYAPNGSSTYNGTRYNVTSGDAIGSYVADNPPAIGKQAGYFLQNGALNAIDLASSTVRWTFTGDGALVTSPMMVNQYVFIGSSSGKLYGVDSATGQSVWNMDLHAPITAGANWGAIVPVGGLAAGDGLLLVPTGSTLTAYELSADP